MSKPVKDKLKDFELLEKFYDIKGDGIAELRLEEAVKSADFRNAVLKIFDAAEEGVELSNDSISDNKVS